MNNMPPYARPLSEHISRAHAGGVSDRTTPADAAGDALNVLVVDADPDTRAVYRRELLAAGLRVFDATDGRDALVQVYSQRPHAIVVDATLPYIDGLQLCALLRQDPATAGIRIVVVTNDGTPERVQRIRTRGADTVIVKPLQADVLVSAVRQRNGDGLLPHPRHSRAEILIAVPPAARRIAKVRARERYVTQRPPALPPRLRCPVCDAELQYDRSHVGGVSDRHPEQWDYFVCATHGVFHYRQRTRRLRAV
jgi:CheY-like chemotaxis protein